MIQLSSWLIGCMSTSILLTWCLISLLSAGMRSTRDLCLSSIESRLTFQRTCSVISSLRLFYKINVSHTHTGTYMHMNKNIIYLHIYTCIWWIYNNAYSSFFSVKWTHFERWLKCSQLPQTNVWSMNLQTYTDTYTHRHRHTHTHRWTQTHMDTYKHILTESSKGKWTLDSSGLHPSSLKCISMDRVCSIQSSRASLFFCAFSFRDSNK